MRLSLMRELTFVAATKEFEFRAIHIRSKAKLLPDLLSRWHQGAWVHNKFQEMVEGTNIKEIEIAQNVFKLSHEW